MIVYMKKCHKNEDPQSMYWGRKKNKLSSKTVAYLYSVKNFADIGIMIICEYKYMKYVNLLLNCYIQNNPEAFLKNCSDSCWL